jgi:hypothetical protein
MVVVLSMAQVVTHNDPQVEQCVVHDVTVKHPQTKMASARGHDAQRGALLHP